MSRAHSSFLSPHDISRTPEQATQQAAAQQPGAAGQATAAAQAFWLFMDLFQAAPTLSAAQVVAREFKARGDPSFAFLSVCLGSGGTLLLLLDLPTHPPRTLVPTYLTHT